MPKVSTNSEDVKVGERIAHLRTRVLPNMPQVKFAARLGVTRGAVGNWELGKGIKRENLQRIASEFGASFEWLATGRGQPVEDPTKITDDGKVRDPAEIREFLERVVDLHEDDVAVLMGMISGFQRANAAPPQHTLSDDRSEGAIPRRESSPYR